MVRLEKGPKAMAEPTSDEKRFEHWRTTFLNMGLEPVFHRDPPMILLMPTSSDRYALGQIYQMLGSKLYQYGTSMCAEAANTAVEAVPAPPQVQYAQPAPQPAPAPPMAGYPPPYNQPAIQPAPQGSYVPPTPASHRPPPGGIGPVPPRIPTPLNRPPASPGAPVLRAPAMPVEGPGTVPPPAPDFG